MNLLALSAKIRLVQRHPGIPIAASQIKKPEVNQRASKVPRGSPLQFGKTCVYNHSMNRDIMGYHGISYPSFIIRIPIVGWMAIPPFIPHLTHAWAVMTQPTVFLNSAQLGIFGHSCGKKSVGMGAGTDSSPQKSNTSSIREPIYKYINKCILYIIHYQPNDWIDENSKWTLDQEFQWGHWQSWMIFSFFFSWKTCFPTRGAVVPHCIYHCQPLK